ncbi:DUF2950 domain-containing protein [Salipiger sp. H15]|uniref:DUF2950 domain-containing protein n=1 Tax=Alloyangia sp. H15 TaxID=3029062 RepID=A0AAU8ADU2_9RHOB
MNMTFGCVPVLLGAAFAGPALAAPQTFDSPEAAVAALVSALEAKDEPRVLAIFGPESEDVLSTGDEAEDRAVWGGFLNDLQTRSRLDVEDEGRATLYLGRGLWPFPAPLVAKDGQWAFDAEAARDEMLMRRIGRNELAVIDILRRAGAIQAEYRKTDHDGDGVAEFAASILSSPGERDGLYWPDEPGTEPSPFDETAARASLTGFHRDAEDRGAEPFDGYYFRILQGQGEHAPGGAYSYMVNGNMVAGHALLAVPAAYGDTGIMSFMVGEGGVVYQSDLGEETLDRAMGIELFDPGEGWEVVR